MLVDEPFHEIHASRRVDHDDLHARPPEPLDPAAEVPVLADEDPRDAELPDQAAAVPARRQRCGDRRVAVRAPAARVAERFDLGVRGGIAIGWAGMAVSILVLVLSPLPRVRQPADAVTVDG